LRFSKIVCRTPDEHVLRYGTQLERQRYARRNGYREKRLSSGATRPRPGSEES